MGAGHAHGHGTAAGASRGRLAAVLGLTLAVLVAEVVGAVVSGSLALLADAGHMATDALGIGLALGAVTLAQRPARGRRTFGWQRVEILAAVANGLLLAGVAVVVVVEAVRRIGDPPDIDAAVVLAVAAAGLVANLWRWPCCTAGRRASLAVRGAHLEVLGDALARWRCWSPAPSSPSPGGRRPTRWRRSWSAASCCRAPGRCSGVLDVLLEAAPRDVDLEPGACPPAGVDGVVGSTTCTPGRSPRAAGALGARVVTDEALAAGHGGRVLDALCACLGDHFDVEHCTFQLEAEAHGPAHEAPVHD
jgi:cobalt-zinc-cadmium efflux system protein